MSKCGRIRSLVLTGLLSVATTALAYGAGHEHQHDNQDKHQHRNEAGDHEHFPDDPVKTMANIVMELKHFPDKHERHQLQDMLSHSDDLAVKTIATALLDMRHTVKEKDKAALEKIINTPDAPDRLRLLARVVHDIKHKPGREAKQQLAKLIGE